MLELALNRAYERGGGEDEDRARENAKGARFFAMNFCFLFVSNAYNAC